MLILSFFFMKNTNMVRIFWKVTTITMAAKEKGSSRKEEGILLGEHENAEEVGSNQNPLLSELKYTNNELFTMSKCFFTSKRMVY